MRFLRYGAGGLIELVEERGTDGRLLVNRPIEAVFHVIQIVEVRLESELGGLREAEFLADEFRRAIHDLELRVPTVAVRF